MKLEEVNSANNSLNQDIRLWVSGLKFYSLKYLAACILDKNELLNEDVKESYHFFLEDIGLDEISHRKSLEFIHDDLDDEEDLLLKNLWLEKVSDFKDVSAVTNGQVIEFSQQLTVMFGENGAGKSSYVRLLNNTFNSRGNKEILPNIYRDGEFHKPSCTFNFKNELSETKRNFPEDKLEDEFQCFTVFDSQSVRAHLDDKNEYKFTPKGFEFFDLFTNGLEKIKALLQEDISRKRKENVFKPLFKSKVKEIVDVLGFKTDIKAFEDEIIFSEDGKAKLENLEREKAKLLALEIEKKLRDKEQLIERLRSFKEKIELLNLELSETKKEEIGFAILDLKKKKEVAKESGVEKFKKLPIQNVGSKSWKSFLSAANIFSSSFSEHYPNGEDHCLYCNQPLSEDAKKLIKAYGDFLMSMAEDEERNSKTYLEKYEHALGVLSFDILDDDSFLRTWLKNEKGEDFLKNWDLHLDRLESIRNSWLNGIQNLSEIDSFKDTKFPLLEIAELIKSEVIELQGLIEKNPKEEIQNVSNKILYYQELKLLSSMKSSIIDYIRDVQWIGGAESKMSKLSTRSATIKQTELFKKYITEDYLRTFEEECKNLKAEFGIKIHQAGRKGNTLRELKIEGHPLKKVLSEGEQRAISLADFLTEIKVAKNNRGIFFDDPVNSLDHKRKKNIAVRLVEESKNRQVIVFTHDLVFLSYLKEASVQLACDCKSHWIKKDKDNVGLVFLNNSPSSESDYKSAKVARDFYSKAKNAEPQNQEYLLKQGFGALRSNYEAFVIFDIFNSVVLRFQERVSIGRLDSVFVKPNIISSIINKTGELSRYIQGHLHSDEYVPEKPTPRLLLEEIECFESLKREHKEFCKTCRKK